MIHWIWYFLVFFMLVFIGRFAFADAEPPSGRILDQWTKEGLLCNSQTATGVCVTGGDEIVMDVRGFKTVGFDSTTSTATSYACDVVTNSVGHDANSGGGHDISSAQITEAAPILVIEGHMRFIWITCPTVADNQVTVWATASRL